MHNQIIEVIDFLKKHGMDYTDIDFNSVVDDFISEMEAGLSGAVHSLAMLPTYIEIPDDIPSAQPVIVLDAGGTNFRVAVVSFDEEKQPVIKDSHYYRMPGIDRETGKKEFFGTIVSYMEDVADQSDRVGFCFSYPTEMLPDKDGRVLHFSKEIKAREVLGELVGEGLRAALKERGYAGDKRIVLLNDTVTTLLAGTTLLLERQYGGYLGFILGTGTNIAYVEKNALIKKLTHLPAGEGQIINIETGDFNLAPGGALDRQLDQGTKDPGRYTYEKMLSGAYFGPLCAILFQAACREGLLSPAAGGALQNITDCDTKMVSEFMRAPFGGGPLAQAVADADRMRLYTLLDRMIERSAKLAAVGLAASVLKEGGGEDPSRPVCIAAEGSTFFGLRGLRFRTEYYLKKHLTDDRCRFFEFVNIKNATLVGAAIAGLTN
jgi:hexokinase